MTSTFTTEFRQEFEAERERWLRKRLLWYLGVSFGFSAIITIPSLSVFVWAVGAGLIPRQQALSASFGVGGALLSMLLYAWAFLYARRTLFDREQMLRFVVRLFVVGGLIGLFGNMLSYEFSPAKNGESALGGLVEVERKFDTEQAEAPEAGEAEGDRSDEDSGARAGSDESGDAGAAPVRSEPASVVRTEEGGAEYSTAEDAPGAERTDRRRVRTSVATMSRRGITFSGLTTILVGHLFLCLFLPLTPKESLRPVLPLLAANLLAAIAYFPGWGWFALAVGYAAVVAIPGAIVCSTRYTRFHSRFQLGALKRRYGEMRQELTDARKIHEALFPKPALEGDVRFDYRYEPMRQIGGDYLHARFAPSAHGPLPALHVSIVDVTGHGIPAALTVNRLHGEIERLFAEHPHATPGLILQLLNRYVHLTLATHSVYVTALCLRVDPNPRPDDNGDREANIGTLEWASGGHPPAFVRSIDGTIHRLDSTTFVLGACHGDDFKHHEQCMTFGPGDVLIAYTDGATEARDRTGRMLRIDGLQRIIAGVTPERGWLAPAVLRAVEQFRFGPPADDTLVVEINRPLS